MVLFFLCCALMHGPAESGGAVVPAERIFALLEAATDREVRRQDPALDLVPIQFSDAEDSRAARVLVLVLRVHGIYVHEIEDAAGEVALVASRDRRPPAPERLVVVAIYAPRHRQPEEIIAALKLRPEAAEVSIVLEPRTGKIVLRGADRALVEQVREAAETEDEPPNRERLVHLYRCDGCFARDAHAELLKLLGREIRSRVVIRAYAPTNMLIVACGSDDWQTVLEHLRKINPAGEPVDHSEGEAEE
jgi:hypothetical protein